MKLKSPYSLYELEICKVILQEKKLLETCTPIDRKRSDQILILTQSKLQTIISVMGTRVILQQQYFTIQQHSASGTSYLAG
jgi:hypothetical protein